MLERSKKAIEAEIKRLSDSSIIIYRIMAVEKVDTKVKIALNGNKHNEVTMAQKAVNQKLYSAVHKIEDTIAILQESIK